MIIKNYFPEYKFIKRINADNKRDDHNIYKGIDVGFGGYVYSKPGIYKNVAVLDVSSEHPNSMIALNYLGKHTSKFQDLVNARIAIKHGDFEIARKLFDGKLEKYLTSKESAKGLSYALKIAINSVYGLTSAKFKNPFMDPRNENNIVALRGALFMVDIMEAVKKEGFEVIHTKTDSIKIPNATDKIIKVCQDFAREYSYEMEYEEKYQKLCLVNDAVFIAKCSDDSWKAVGTEFAIPFVFKTLFSKEKILFKDLCETKAVTSAMYLDFNENLSEDEHNLVFIGKVGSFVPVLPNTNGGLLVREASKKEGFDAVVGTKGYRWKESTTVLENDLMDQINMEYFEKQVEQAKEDISKFGDLEEFLK